LDETARAGQKGEDISRREHSQKRIAENRTARKGQAEQDSQNRGIARTGQA
jgi:hypothetical protein